MFTVHFLSVLLTIQSNFLHGFSALSPHKTKKSKVTSGQLDGLWLALFVNLSFSTEGQTMILKTDGKFTLLLCVSVCLSGFC